MLPVSPNVCPVPHDIVGYGIQVILNQDGG